MTGWRLGWLSAPRVLMDDLGKLVEYNTSCAPAFVQAAGIAAIEQGEPFARQFVADPCTSRDHLVRALAALPGVDVKTPPGAMYLFFSLPGAQHSLDLCKTLVRDAGLGLAPGAHSGRRARASCAGAMCAISRGSTRASGGWRGIWRRDGVLVSAGACQLAHL